MALSSVDVTAVVNVHYCHEPIFVIDPVDDLVGAATRAGPVVHRREKSPANPVSLSQERAGDELVGRSGYGLRESPTQCATDGGSSWRHRA